MDKISIQTGDFNVTDELTALRQGQSGVGAVCCFVGAVRDRGDVQDVQSLELEHYPGMTERAIAGMVEAARRRFDIVGVSIIHRVGVLALGDQIVMVAVSSAHRGQSFQACEFLMDYLKTQAPFWKKEASSEGGKWVDARVADDDALKRWGLDLPNRV
ncbi:MAG: hypothetical protein RLZZ271_1671 [Pseudomonadota bacterium]|jgi:molybdopterin synthase catalytic subunit